MRKIFGIALFTFCFLHSYAQNNFKTKLDFYNKWTLAILNNVDLQTVRAKNKNDKFLKTLIKNVKIRVRISDTFNLRYSFITDVVEPLKYFSPLLVFVERCRCCVL